MRSEPDSSNYHSSNYNYFLKNTDSNFSSLFKSQILKNINPLSISSIYLRPLI